MILIAISVISVSGKRCLSRSDMDDSSHQYKKLTCTVCNTLQQFTAMSSMLLNELANLRHVDDNFILDLNVRLIHYLLLLCVYKN